MSTRSFGHRERSGSALSLRGNQIAVDATSSLSRFPRGLARVPAGVQRRELREVERRERLDAVLVHRQVLERRERRPERLGWGQALERAVVALDRRQCRVGAELGQLRQRQVSKEREREFNSSESGGTRALCSELWRSRVTE